MPGPPQHPASETLRRSEETLLVLAARAGDPTALGQLILRFERPLIYYLRRLTASPEAALDVHQEVWLAVQSSLPRLQSPEAFRGWLYRIAHDKAARFVRREIAQEGRLLSWQTGQAELAESPEDPALADAAAVHRALDDLPPLFREVLTLHYLRDLTLEEIATVLGCPVGTVKSRLHHARHTLRQILESTAHEPHA